MRRVNRGGACGQSHGELLAELSADTGREIALRDRDHTESDTLEWGIDNPSRRPIELIRWRYTLVRFPQNGDGQTGIWL